MVRGLVLKTSGRDERFQSSSLCRTAKVLWLETAYGSLIDYKLESRGDGTTLYLLVVVPQHRVYMLR